MKKLIRALRQTGLILTLLISPIFGQADDDNEPLLLLWASAEGNLFESGLSRLVDVNNLGLKVLSGKFTLTQTGAQVQTILDGTFSDGTAAAPSINFASETNSGLYREAQFKIGFTINGATRATLTANNFYVTTSNAGLIREATTTTNPTISTNVLNDSDTGIGGETDALSIIAGGDEIARFDEAGQHNYLTLKGEAKLDDRNSVIYFDEFTMKVLDETNENWILNAGSDGAAVDPVVVIARNGTVFLDAGVGDGSVAEDGSQIVWAIPVQVGDGSLVLEARLKIEDITGVSVNVGLTDITTLEEPFSIANATITSIADNAICFVFDDGATAKEWFRAGTDATTDATGQGATGTAPVNDTYQILRIEIDGDGEGAEFFINGVSEGVLTAAAIHATTDAYFTITVVGDGGNASAVGVTIDYMYIAYSR